MTESWDADRLSRADSGSSGTWSVAELASWLDEISDSISEDVNLRCPSTAFGDESLDLGRSVKLLAQDILLPNIVLDLLSLGVGSLLPSLLSEGDDLMAGFEKVLRLGRNLLILRSPSSVAADPEFE